MTRNRMLLRALQLVLLGAVLWFIADALAPQLARLTWADVIKLHPRWLPLLASLLLLLSIHFAHAMLWRRILQDLAIGSPSPRVAARLFVVSGLGRYVPGRVWQLASMAVLAGRVGLPPVAASAASALGWACYLATGVLFLALAMPRLVGAASADGAHWSAWPVMVLLLLAGGLFWVLAVAPVARGVRHRLAQLVGERLGEHARAALALAERVRPRAALVWLLGYALTWIVLASAFLLFVIAFVPSAASAPRYIGGTIAASYLAGYVLPLPAGIGGREVVMLGLLSAIMDPGAALVVSVLSRVWFTASELLPLALLPLVPDGGVEEVRT